ncbi:Protein Ycf2 [Labeo rohita]|uniref:Protein Ycf2 n=1 Tax=Labeo rohita TaxID=84645 RepID=A0ABQ8LXN4_LABRO|nr:Protein Ycf2 [Labeo rohita]
MPRVPPVCGVEDLQYVEAVVGPLSEGIVSISNICKSLLDAQIDQTTGMCYNYEQIRRHIEHAEQCLKKSETVIKEKLGYLDECMEQLIQEKENAEQQKKEKCMAKDKLHTEKNSAEESLKNYKAALEQAEKNLESAKYALKVHQDRKSSGEGVTTTGAALLALPVIGWIAGPIMICEGARVTNEASKDIRVAEDELKKNESQVNESSMKVSNYRSRISSIQNEIEETDKVLHKNERKVKEVKQHLEVTADIQQMVRRAVNLLSVLTGRVTVLEKQTQRFILWQPVIKAMEDAVKAAGNIAENRLLYSQGASVLINTLRENVGGLQTLCNSPSNSEYDSYY